MPVLDSDDPLDRRDFVSNLLVDCPCGAGLVRERRRPDRTCQVCRELCGKLVWNLKRQRWLCHVCREPGGRRSDAVQSHETVSSLPVP